MPRSRTRISGPDLREHNLPVPKCKWGAYTPFLATFASNLDCEPNQELTDLRIIFGYLAEYAHKHPSKPLSSRRHHLLHPRASCLWMKGSPRGFRCSMGRVGKDALLRLLWTPRMLLLNCSSGNGSQLCRHGRSVEGSLGDRRDNSPMFKPGCPTCGPD